MVVLIDVRIAGLGASPQRAALVSALTLSGAAAILIGGSMPSKARSLGVARSHNERLTAGKRECKRRTERTASSSHHLAVRYFAVPFDTAFWQLTAPDHRSRENSSSIVGEHLTLPLTGCCNINPCRLRSTAYLKSNSASFCTLEDDSGMWAKRSGDRSGATMDL